MSGNRYLTSGAITGVAAIALGTGIILAGGMPADRQEPPATQRGSDAGVLDAYGRLPLSFEANAGQTASDVRFLARGAGYTAYLTDSGAVYSLTAPTLEPGAVGASATPGGAAVSMEIVGGDPSPEIEGLGILPGVVNYFRGSDPGRWLEGVATYRKVESREVYPGIDVIFHGTGQHLEYDFVLAPGADPWSIRLRFEGAEELRLDESGDLVISTAVGDLVHRAPTVYQEVGGQRRMIEGAYRIDRGLVGFRLGSYDAGRTLLIDPLVDIVYSTLLGGRRNDYAYGGVAVDGAGSAFIAGYTRDAAQDFPTTPGAFSTTHGGQDDVFVAKLTPSGDALAYSTFLGGSDYEGAYAMAVDGAGAAYVTGETYEGTVPFPTTGGAYATTHNGYGDVFVAKLTPSGGSLAYSTFLGGGGYEWAEGIAVDGAGAAYVSGVAEDPGFPTTPSAFDESHNGNDDVFVTKVNPAGSALLYSTFLGGDAYEASYGIAVDGAGATYVTGVTDGGTAPAFPTTAGAFDESHNGNDDAFVTKVDPTGGALGYSTFLGGDSSDEGQAIAVDGAGAAYVAGRTFDGTTDLPTTSGAFDETHNGSIDVFVTKLGPSGAGPLAYSTFLGAGAFDLAYAIALDGTGSAYVTGSTQEPNAGPDFPTTPGAHSPSRVSETDAFLTQLEPSGGGPLLYSTFLGGSDSDGGYGVAIDGSGAAFVTGYSDDGYIPFPTMPGAIDRTYNGGIDAFLTKVGVPATCKGKAATHTGTDGNDTIKGTSEADVVATLGGNDVVKGLGGDDVVCGGDGNDKLSGGGGDDKLNGDKGKDRLKGGSGNDKLNGGKKKDTCVGGSGKDKAAKCENEKTVP